MKAENWFQLRVVGVTKRSRDSDLRRSPLVRCGIYVSPACTLDLAPVQVRERVGVLLNRASLEVPFGKCQLLHRDPWPTRAQAGRAISDYIEVFYNRKRRHSHIGDMSPAAFEAVPATLAGCPRKRGKSIGRPTMRANACRGAIRRKRSAPSVKSVCRC